MKRPLLIRRDLEAINEALSARLAGELDGTDADLPREHYEAAQDKIQEWLQLIKKTAARK